MSNSADELSLPRQPTPFLRKPLAVVQREQRQEALRQSSTVGGSSDGQQGGGDHVQLARHLSLLDLVSIGVGGTIGSGVFVLCGLIANQYAGPATFISWAIAGVAAFLSGCCYAELSGRIPTAGSSYAYAHVSMGELPAVVTASMLTLEYLVSGAAVARSWGDKIVEWLRVELGAGEWVETYLNPGWGFNPMAMAVSAVTCSLVYGGVRESKIVTDIFTWIKALLVVFMAVGGLMLLNTSNLKPLIPPEFGIAGVMRGATSSFFGYLGFDGICCVAGEAQNPTVNLPKAVVITLLIVTVLYIVAAFSLVGMQNYTEISPESAFPEAFAANGVEWAAQLTAAGEIITLPVVVLLSSVLQPRLFYALAWDGFLPPVFGKVDSHGNLRKGILISGSCMTVLAGFVPFADLDDFVSAGILVAFSITNSSLVLMRRESPPERPFLLEKMLLVFSFLSLVTGLVLRHASLKTTVGLSVAVCILVATAAWGFLLAYRCPKSIAFGGDTTLTTDILEDAVNQRYFETPCVPFVPLLGIFTNWYLVAQLEFLGIVLLILYVACAILVYWMYGAKHSVGNNTNWNQSAYERAAGEIEMDELDDREQTDSAKAVRQTEFT